jgi:A/G-specific adenine glycosylase
VRSRVLRWGRRNFVSYPWRHDTDPWLTFVAELLLQRTRATQALAAYEILRQRYPTPADLLRTGQHGVMWLTRLTGLHGRGRTLLAAAHLFEHSPQPPSGEELRGITGVGAYTVAAWQSLHRGERAVIVDSNVFRWLGRMTGRPFHRDPRGVHWVHDLAAALTPPRAFRDYNYAVLDFTMKICIPREPRCEICPLIRLCDYGHRRTARR